MQRESWSGLLVGALGVACLTAFSFNSAEAAVGGGGAGNTTFTNSTTRHDTHTRVDLPDVQAYQTRVLGYVYSTGAAGNHDAYVYDRTTPNSPSSGEVQTLFNQASSAVNSALHNTNILPGRSASLEQGEPAMVGQRQSRSDSSKIGEQLNHTETSVTTTASLGPGTIMIGEDQSQTFYVAAGTTNFNTNVHTESFIDDLFQATTTTSTTYQVTGHKYVSPLILDLTGSGKVQASDGVYRPHPGQFHYTSRKLFDFYGNGFPVAMEWVGPQDGLLCQPKTDGTVDGTCLFGTATGYESGFEHLASLDKNMDYKVSGNELAGLMVWQDKNQNARADQGELTSLQDLGITELSVRNSADVGSFTMKGKSCKMFDWWPTVMQVKKVKNAV